MTGTVWTGATTGTVSTGAATGTVSTGATTGTVSTGAATGTVSTGAAAADFWFFFFDMVVSIEFRGRDFPGAVGSALTTRRRICRQLLTDR